MEKNYVSESKPTHFYINLQNKTYGVCINKKDVNNAKKIINYFKKDRKEQIESWKQNWKEGII